MSEIEELNKIRVIDDVIPEFFSSAIESMVKRGGLPFRFTASLAGAFSDRVEFIDKRVKNTSGLALATKIVQDENNGYEETTVIHHQIFLDFLIRKISERAFGHSDIKLLRSKVNLSFPLPGYTQEDFCLPHIDRPDEHIVFLYYINDSDGDTVFFKTPKFPPGYNEELQVIKRVTPKRGRVAIFDGSVYHTQCNPINTEYRMNINMNLRIGKDSKRGNFYEQFLQKDEGDN